MQNWVLWVLSCCSLIARAREIRPSGSKLRPFYQSVRKLSVDYRLIEKYCIASTVLNFGKAITLPSYKIFSTIFWRLETIVLIHFYENGQIKRNSSMYSKRRHLYFNKIKLSVFFFYLLIVKRLFVLCDMRGLYLLNTHGTIHTP